MIYLYGLMSDGPGAPYPSLRDIQGVTGPVDTAVTSLGVLVFGRTETADFTPKRRYLMAHARVLEACLSMGDLLPMRFGMTAQDKDQIVKTLHLNEAEIEAQFERIGGQVEFGIKIAFPREAALNDTIAADPALSLEHRRLSAMERPPHFAVAEFGRRLAEALERRRTNAQKAILPGVARLCGDHVLAKPEDDVQVLNMHALAPRNMADDLARAAEAEAKASGFAASTEPHVKLIGPEPPFHFVQVSLTTTSAEAA